MNKKQIIVSGFTTMLFLLLVVSISFAWYKADVDNKAIDLASAGITLTLDSKSGNTLTPDVLIEGVYNGSLPDDYEENKNLYTTSIGNELYFQEKVKLIYASYTNVTFDVLFTTGEVEDASALDYLNVDIYVSSTKIDDYNTLSTPLISLTSETKSVAIEDNLSSLIIDDEFYMVVKVSYKLTNEELPVSLLQSDVINLKITATLN